MIDRGQHTSGDDAPEPSGHEYRLRDHKCKHDDWQHAAPGWQSEGCLAPACLCRGYWEEVA